jgi:malate dehydrogenase
LPTAEPAKAFNNVSAAFLVGAMPRKEGMERKDLLAANVEIFKVQGEALDKYAHKDVKVLVVGNPANTNALICSHYAPSIPKENFTAMTRLDQNRAQAALAARLNIQVIYITLLKKFLGYLPKMLLYKIIVINSVNHYNVFTLIG